nr:MAG TPA: hypothetical protein [Caudoviricetes sp.]
MFIYPIPFRYGIYVSLLKTYIIYLNYIRNLM